MLRTREELSFQSCSSNLTIMKQLLRFIWDHPISKKNRLASFMRLIWWQCISRMKTDVLVRYGVSSRLLVRRGMSGATGNVYCGLHEFEEMAFFLQLARPGDLFLDVGANIGSYSVLVPNETGCDSISFEPIPQTFSFLKRNMEVNGLSSPCHRLHNAGVGDSKAFLRFSSDRDTTNSVMSDDEDGGIEVEVVPLDEVVPSGRTCWMKVDVEGFEMDVIQGATRVLREVGGLVIELNGAGEKFGNPDDKVRDALVESGFVEVRYSPTSRVIQPAIAVGDNAFFVRLDQYKKIESRLKSAPYHCVRGVKF